MPLVGIEGRREYRTMETWDGECELIEEDNIKLYEASGDDPTHDRFQVSARTFEPNVAKVSVMIDRQCLSSRSGFGNREVKTEHKSLQLGHGRNPLEQNICQMFCSNGFLPANGRK